MYEPIVFVFDTAKGPSLIRADAMYQIWLDNIGQSDISEIQAASDTKKVVSGNITFKHPMGVSLT